VLFGQPKVLIVDDTDIQAKILVQLLKDICETEVACDGAEGLKKACQKPQPDLIISDVMMPEINGFELCDRLKSMPETRDIPVMLITVMDADQDQVKGLELGAVDYIVKPYQLEVVKARVKRQLEMKAARDLLSNQSHVDILTGIPNRRRFEEVLKSEWKRAYRKQDSLSLMIIAIDYFKEYKDYHGHQAGDTCLRQVARLLTETIRRSGDLVARYEGEEFVCLLPSVDSEKLSVVAEKILQAVRDACIPHEASPAGEYLTVSIGCDASTPKDAEGKDRLVRKADQALFEAKSQGRNQAVVSIPREASTEDESPAIKTNGP